jgi:uroporphyrin-III C-methyltransferase
MSPRWGTRQRKSSGIVYIVGAGPGDPELITVRGLKALRTAHTVVYDRLVHPALLDEAPLSAERVYVGKTPGRPNPVQDDIHALLVRRAREGKVVVRLKGGDPFVFGRGGEECEALQAAGVRYEMVPGVTSATAVPALAGIPVTHRRFASAFAVATGQLADGADDLDWAALARIPTLVVLMGLRRLDDVTARLIAHGADPTTPAAVIASGTLPEQRSVIGTLNTIAGLVRDAGLKQPATLVVGAVVRVSAVLDQPTRSGAAACLETVVEGSAALTDYVPAVLPPR